MECRRNCGACCIAPSIETPFYGMPKGKPAGDRCVHLGDGEGCRLFGDARRPAFCVALQANLEMCGDNREYAMHYLSRLDQLTR
ncbi:hypothetical protein AB833_30735 [Chromatiales bacterium (ex Bugula neritina AB1)]|nr:hypothetical protein AB833_30735 [Chromatiales bacterium (ex Bugula neritina AB1)]